METDARVSKHNYRFQDFEITITERVSRGCIGVESVRDAIATDGPDYVLRPLIEKRVHQVCQNRKRPSLNSANGRGAAMKGVPGGHTSKRSERMELPSGALLPCPFCGSVPEQQCSDVWYVMHRRGCWCAPKTQRIVGLYAATCWQQRHGNEKGQDMVAVGG